jgi:hypothetical protein
MYRGTDTDQNESMTCKIVLYGHPDPDMLARTHNNHIQYTITPNSTLLLTWIIVYFMLFAT